MATTLILGSVGTGKSYLASNLHRHYFRRVVIDPRGEHEGDIVTNSAEEFLTLFASNEPSAFNGKTVVYRDLLDQGDHSETVFEFLGSLNGFCIFIDEVDQFCNPYRIPPAFRRLLNYQRHFGIDLILVARRAASVHRDVSALASEIFLFHTHEKTDRQYIGAVCGEEFEKDVSQLPKWQFLRQTFPPEHFGVDNIGQNDTVEASEATDKET